MKPAEELVQMVRPDGRRGVVISKGLFEIYSSFILQCIEAQADYTLNDVLERAKEYFNDAIESDIAWHILQVKLDLEARGLIKVISPVYQKRTFFIKLTRQGMRKIKLTEPLNNLNVQ